MSVSAGRRSGASGCTASSRFVVAIALMSAVGGFAAGAFGQGYDRSAATTSARSMVLARRGMICASQPLAAEAGLAVLRAGGNAFDAAVAAAAVLNVVEPMSTGIGGDMYALAWSAKEGRLVGLNGSGRSAAAATVARYRELGLDAIPTHGPHAITVPGAFHGWATLIENHGSLPLGAILADAIRHADEGFAVSEVIAENWQGGLVHREVAEFARTYLVRDGDDWRAPRLGEIVRQPDLARTFRALAAGGIDTFYRGEIAQRIAAFLESEGSLIRAVDLAKHSSTFVAPVSTDYRGYVLHELPPNGQGIVALEMLNILEGYDLRALGHNSTGYVHLLAEAKKLAFADRDTFITDLDYRKLPVETLISKPYAERMRARIDRGRAGRFEKSTLEIGDDTVYLATADRDGNMVSFINSLFYGFGSGLVVPGTGICLQNRGALFRLDDAHRNRIEPSKRPLHTIIPAFVTRDGKPWLCYGVMGGDMQPQGHVQVLVNLVDFGMNPQEAGEAARVREADGAVFVENGVAAATIDGLRALGHRVERAANAFGGYQGILVDRERGVYLGGSDNRKDGCALGY